MCLLRSSDQRARVWPRTRPLSCIASPPVTSHATVAPAGSSMTETVWFDEPIEHGGAQTDRLVVEDAHDRDDVYEFRTPEGETLTVPKENVRRIE